MSDHTCINCGHALSANFCELCGQKASTHRYTLKHVFSHDLIHGVFHLDKGFLYTAKELFTRPGYSVREYVEGKRAKHFNYVTFLVILVAVDLLVQHASHFSLTEALQLQTPDNMLEKVQSFAKDHMKELYIATIPMNALATSLVFRSSRQNFAEHLVMNTYKEGGILMINICFLTLFLVNQSKPFVFTVYALTGLTVLVYNACFYWQYFRKDHHSSFILFLKTLGALLLTTIFVDIVIVVILVIKYPEHIRYFIK